MDPISIVVLAGTVGISGMVVSRQDKISAALERRFDSWVDPSHRLIVDTAPEKIYLALVDLSSKDKPAE